MPIALVYVVVLLLLPACASSAAGNAGEELPEVSIDKYDNVSATLDFDAGVAVLPLDSFSKSAPEIQTKVLHAIAVRADKCLAQRGLQTVADSQDWSPYIPEENRRYGGWSVEIASQYGFDAPPNTGLDSRVVDVLTLGVDFNKAYAECMATARDSLMDQLNFLSQADIDRRIRWRSEDLALVNDEGKAAVDRWRSCMENNGVVLDPQSGFPSEKYQEQSKEIQIQIAVTQAQCGVSTNAVRTLFDLQARYEAAYIDAQAAALQEFEQRLDATVAVLDAAIAGQ